MAISQIELTYEEKCRIHDRGVEAEVAGVLQRLARLVEKRAGERYEEQPANQQPVGLTVETVVPWQRWYERL